MVCTIRGPPTENVQLEVYRHQRLMHGYMERTIVVKAHIMIKTSRRMTIMKSITRRMNMLWISILILGLAFGSAALPLFVSTASAASVQPAAAPADPLVGYGAGTTGGAGGP